ncbi:MAG: hypothetical protein P8L77_00760 [Gammaproteobacteria bacterium]|nr:hypothetical protein [Gammaproteobacteria bacterium]
MNSIATIGYTSNLYARDQKTINYFEFQAMLADQVSDRLHWYATIHPRDEEDAYLDASERLSLCVQSQLQSNDKVLVVGGDVSALYHMPDWISGNQLLGVSGMAESSLATFFESLPIPLAFDHLTLGVGLDQSPVGLWWPADVSSTSIVNLPSNLRVLFVPELESGSQMLKLIDILKVWV